MKQSRLFGALALASALVLPGAAALAQDGAQNLPAPNWWLLDPTTDRGVPGIGVERAYRELLAGRQPKRTVVVAIIDSGVEIDHPDLKNRVWTNEDEVAGNGRDDDRNGYVDDVHGWDFLGSRTGEDIHYDTFESTRLTAAGTRRFAGVNPDTLSAAVRAEYDLFVAARTKFRADSAETAGIAQQLRMIGTVVQQAMDVLRRAAGSDALTPERVASLQGGADVQQAKQLYAQLAANGVTPEQLAEEAKSIEGRLQYGYNLSFNPRTTIGDDPNNPAERGYGNGEVEGPDASHGTHVAGIVAAQRGNGVGMDGVADAVRIMALRTVPEGDERDKDVANAIRYAVDNGASVVNMSFGKSFSPGKAWVDEAVRYAESKGVLLVHGAGNDGSSLDEETNFPNHFYAGGGQSRTWIEVGASSWDAPGALAASFSNYSKTKVDVFAPGVSIYSASTGGTYVRNDGTSMASPVVAGVAALLMAYFPELSAADVRQIILDTATKYTQAVERPGAEEGAPDATVPFSELSATGGVVNAYAAVQAAIQRTGGARR